MITPTNPIAELRRRYFETDRDQALRVLLENVLAKGPDGRPIAAPERFTAGGETRGLVISGEPGSGKTTLIEHVLMKDGALASDDEAAPRWIKISVPSPATVKSLGLELLDRLGYPVKSPSAPAWTIWQTVRHRIGVLGVVLIWIDEAHDLLNPKQAHETAAMLKMLKALMQGDNAVVVVLSGIDALRTVIAQDQQVARRFAKLPLPPVSAAAQGEQLGRALRGYCRFAGVAHPSEPELMLRIVHAARGQFGRCLELMIGAIEIAHRYGHAQVDQRHFAQYFAAQEGCDPAGNVFLSPRWSSLALDAAA